VITIDKVKGAPGDLVEFAEVLILGGDNVLVGTPIVAGASVAGEVVEQTRGAKVIAFKKRRRKNSRRKRGHRQELSVIRITEILTDGRKPTPRTQAAEAAPAEEAEPAGPPEVEAAAVAEAGASETSEAKPAKKRARKPAAAKSVDED
jgi:large subunit ribosomal protein L21